jgi:hypothetical protein
MELLAEHPLKRLASSVPGFGEYIPVFASLGALMRRSNTIFFLVYGALTHRTPAAHGIRERTPGQVWSMEETRRKGMCTSLSGVVRACACHTTTTTTARQRAPARTPHRGRVGFVWRPKSGTKLAALPSRHSAVQKRHHRGRVSGAAGRCAVSVVAVVAQATETVLVAWSRKGQRR